MRFINHKEPANVTQEFENVYSQIKGKSFDFYNRAPSAQEVPERGIVLAFVDPNFKIYVKINGALKSVTIA